MVYDPSPALRHFRRLLPQMVNDLATARILALALAKRDILAMYQQTFLGYFWAFLLPVVNTLTWLFLRGAGIVKLEDTTMSYPVYVITGTVLWQVFTEAFQAPIQEVAASKTLLTKINFPREALILSGIWKTLFNAGIKLIVLVPVVLWLGVVPSWSILLFPIGVFSLVLMGTAIGCLLSPVSLLYADVSRATALLLQLAMYLTPVVYAMPSQGMLAKINAWNVVTPVLMNTRNWLAGVQSLEIGTTIAIHFGAVLVLLLAWITYRIAMSRIVERIG